MATDMTINIETLRPSAGHLGQVVQRVPVLSAAM
jgi:hypothetical protein